MTKKKFIWLLFDGLAFDEISFLYEKKKNSAVFYKISTNFFKQSGALHEMYITGKFSRNFLASKTQVDNLLYQMNKSDYALKYIGEEYPFYYLGGGKLHNSENYFKNHHLQGDAFPFSVLCYSHSSSIFYPITFSYSLPDELNNLDFNKNKLMEKLDNDYLYHLQTNMINSCFNSSDLCCHSNSKNLIYYTKIIDSFNHGYSKEHSKTFAASYAINKGIMKMIDWIDENQDYVLILSSDHGGQAYLGEDNYCNHGCSDPGNEGVLFIYMKNFNILKPVKEAEIISTFEVSNIISQVIENVNIPIESRGKITKIVENSYYNI